MNEIPVQNPENTLSEDSAKIKAILMDIFILETPSAGITKKHKDRTVKIISPKENQAPSKIYIADYHQKLYDKFVTSENDSELGTALGRMMFAGCFSPDTGKRKLRNLLMPYLSHLASIDVTPQEELGGMVFGPVKGMIESGIITRQDRNILLPLLPCLAKTDGGGGAICMMAEGCYILDVGDRNIVEGLLPDLAKTPMGAHAIALMVAEGFFGHTDKEMLWKLIPDILSRTGGAHEIASMIAHNIFTLEEIQHAFQCDETQLKIIITSLEQEVLFGE